MGAIQSFCNSSFAFIQAFCCSGVREELNRVPSTTRGRVIRTLEREVTAMEDLKAVRSILCTTTTGRTWDDAITPKNHNPLLNWIHWITSRDSAARRPPHAIEALLRLVKNCLNPPLHFLPPTFTPPFFTRRCALQFLSSLLPPHPPADYGLYVSPQLNLSWGPLAMNWRYW